MTTTLWDKIPFKKIKIKAENKFGKKISENIFLYSLSLMIIIYALMCASFKSAGALISLIDNIRYIAAFAVIIKIYFLSDYNLKQLALLSILYVYIFTNSVVARDSTLFFTSVMIFGAKDVSYKKICKYVFATTIICTLLIFILFFMGVLNDVLVPRGDDFRHSLGFAHPNNTGLWILCCAVSFQQYFSEKLKLWHYAVIPVIAVFMYVTANSRAAFIALMLITLIMPFVKNIRLSPDKEKILSNICISIVILIYAAIFIMVIFYDETSAFQKMLDNLFSYRISLSHSAFEHYGLTLLGDSTPLLEGIYILDCMQVRIAFSYGIITLLLTLAMFCYVQKKAIQHKHYYIAIMGLILLVYGLMETFPYNFAFNVTLLAVGAKLNE